jgi:N-acetyl-gamma-glutamyl-phosphate reductase common form
VSGAAVRETANGSAVREAGILAVREAAGGTVARAPAGGVAVRAPAASAVVRAPAGGAAVRAPAASAVVRAPAGGAAVRAPAGGAAMVQELGVAADSGGATAPGAAPRTVTANSGAAVPVLVLGGSGYVAGEALRLLAGHPRLVVAGVVSESQPGQLVAEAFPHLASAYPGARFSAIEDVPRLIELAAEVAGDGGAGGHGAAGGAGWEADGERAAGAAGGGQVAALCAAPHGASAKLVDLLLAAAEGAGPRLRVVDLSADFRFAAAADYERVYGHAHGAPGRLPRFRCALPEHAELAFALGAEHVGHPGCFPTAVLLAAVPLVRLGWVEPSLHVVAVTGSTGAGRTPSPSTHHPARRSNLFAYNPLAHRHEPEMRALATAAAGQPVVIHFVPQAGPFARGIYATVQARLLQPAPAGRDVEQAAAVAADLARFYAAAPFVDVIAEPPRLQDVVGTNRCRIGVAVAGDRLVAFSAIDNLTKGAAGGGIQWLNRLLGFPETAGLTQPGIGWL